MAKFEGYTVKFEKPLRDIEVQARTIHDAIDIALERTGLERENIYEIDFPDEYGETSQLSGSALWMIL